MSPKRALFSLNLDSDADHIYQRVDEHSKEGTDRVKIIETKGPSHTHTDLSYITKPFENIVNRTVDGVIEGTGKKVHSAQGEIHYNTESSSSTSSRRTINVKNNSRRKKIEEKYDTSEL
jgi:ribose 5-phosphate isomerase B